MLVVSFDFESFRVFVDSNPKIPAGKTYLEVFNQLNEQQKSLKDFGV